MKQLLLAALLATAALPAAQNVLVLTTEGKWITGMTKATKVGAYPISRILSLHNGAPASSAESAAISAGLAAIAGKDRKARDLAVENLTHIGLPVLTPFLEVIRDTDQHEPKPLYNLFNRLVPSIADQPDRTSGLIRLEQEAPRRGEWPIGSITVGNESISWNNIRLFGVERKTISRTVEVHSLRHSTQIEYLDTGLYVGAESHWVIQANGFTRLSWKQDDWATNPNGLTKPAGNYKTNLVDGHPFGALLARISATGETKFIGVSSSAHSPGNGRLHLAINDNAHWQNNLGSYTVKIVLTRAFDLGAPI
jgi:hypothetical protein